MFPATTQEVGANLLKFLTFKLHFFPFCLVGIVRVLESGMCYSIFWILKSEMC
jgi:hypothetical protein